MKSYYYKYMQGLFDEMEKTDDPYRKLGVAVVMLTLSLVHKIESKT